MSTHLIFPAPSLQEPGTPTSSRVIGTRLGRPAVSLNPTLFSTSPLRTSSADSNTVLKSGWVVTQIGEITTATATPQTATSLVDRPTPEISPIILHAGLSESHSALIMSSITFVLVVALIIVLVAWFVILRRQRKRSLKEETGESMGYLDKERGIPYESDNDSMNGEDDETREGAEGSRRNADSFNSLNMVVDRSVITSMALSQITRASNPPPPYGNAMTDSGNDRIDGAQADSPQRSRSSSQPVDGGQPLVLNSQTLMAIPGAEASFAALARLLPPTMTVRYTFTPASPDEMEVKKGDKMQITGVFDDGWCLCRAEGGRVGVVPLACLDIPESAFTSSDPVGSGFRVQNVTSNEGVPHQKEENNGSGVVSERELVNRMRFGVLGREGEEEKGRLVTRSPRLSSRSVVIVQNGSRDNK